MSSVNPRFVNPAKNTIIILLTLLLAAPVIGFAGTTYYVNGSTGNDSNSGTQSSPWKTIQKAANAMTGGDTLVVASGTYPERVIVSKSGSSGAAIKYTANGNVECRGFTIQANYIHIIGFKVTSSTTSPTEALYGFWVNGTSCVIEDNYAYYNPKGGINLRPTSSSCVIRGNRLHRKTGS